MDNRRADCTDVSFRPTENLTCRTGNAINSSSNLGLADSDVNLPYYRVDASDVGHIRNSNTVP